MTASPDRAWPSLALALPWPSPRGRRADVEEARHQRQERLRGGRASSTSTTTASSTSSRATPGTRRPDWTPYPGPRRRRRPGTYFNDFATLPIDVNGDGKIDFVTAAYFSQERRLGREPRQGRQATGPITRSTSRAPARPRVRSTSTGDGMPRHPAELDQRRRLVRAGEGDGGKGYTWKKHDFSATKGSAGHGVGTGDVNGDGRVDLLTPKGWFEAPADPRNDTWAWHPDWKLGGHRHPDPRPRRRRRRPGRRRLGHGPRLSASSGSSRAKAADGKVDAGPSRRRSTRTSPRSTPCSGPTSTATARPTSSSPASASTPTRSSRATPTRSVIAYYTFDPAKKAWDQHVIFQGEPAKDAPADAGKRDAQKDFPPGTAGTGLQMTAIDIDGDGDIDLVCPGKSGLYLFENLLKSK